LIRELYDRILDLESDNGNLVKELTKFEAEHENLLNKLEGAKELKGLIIDLENENESNNEKISILEKDLQEALDALVEMKNSGDSDVNRLKDKILELEKLFEENDLLKNQEIEEYKAEISQITQIID